MGDFFMNSSFSFGQHYGKDVIWIITPNELYYRNYLKTNLSSARWSSSNKSWYVFDNAFNRKALKLPAKQYSGKELLKNIDEINQQQLILFIEQLRLKCYSESTVKTYSVEFAQWLYVLGRFPVVDTTPSQLRSYLLYCINELKLSENQIHSRLNALKFYYEKVLFQEKFFFEIPRPKKQSSLPKVFSTLEIKRLFLVTTNIKHLVILKICYGLGLRVSEIATLKIQNIDSHRMLVHVQNAKGKKDRYVPLPQSILEELRQYYLEYKPKVYLFEGPMGGPYSIRSIQSIFKIAKDKAKITKPVGIHGLRHSYATHLLEYGTDMSIIQKLLGHNNIKTTNVYAKVSNTFLSKIINPLDELY